MVVVRFLLFLSLASILVAAGFYLFKRDRRYLRFIGQVVKYTLLMIGIVLIFFLFERLILII
jgi:hypothetical protein